MKRRKRLRKRGFALFLALVVCFSSLHLTAFADDETPSGGDTISQDTGGGDTTAGGSTDGSDSTGGSTGGSDSTGGSTGGSDSTGGSTGESGGTGSGGAGADAGENGSTGSGSDENGTGGSDGEGGSEHDTSYSDTKTETDTKTGETTTTTTSGWADIDDSDLNKKTESSEVKVEITITDKDGNVLEGSGTIKGESTTTTTGATETVEPGTPDDEQPPTVDVTPGETTTVETPGQFETTGTTPETTETEEIKGDLPYAGDITVTLKPGQHINEKGEVLDAANNPVLDANGKPVIVNNKASLTDQQLAALLFGNDSDYPLNEMLTEPKVETNENGETVTTSTSQEDGKFIKTVVTERADGSKVEEKTTVELKGTPNDKGGQNVTEFIVTTVTTTTYAPGTEQEVEEGEVTTGSVTVTDDPETQEETHITLPDKPQADESTAEDGTKTVVTVEDILDDEGNIVGYQKTTTITSADGKQVSSQSESVWGTKTTVYTTTQKDTTTTTGTSTNKVTTTTTTLITQGTTVSGHKITATDREVTASMGKVEAGKDNGKVEMKPTLTPGVKEPDPGKTSTTKDLYDRPDATLTVGSATGGKDSSGNAIYNATITSDKGTYEVHVAIDKQGNVIPADKDFAWFGEYGLESAIRVNTREDGMGTWQPHQFVLTSKNGEKFYVYCADFEVNPVSGAAYNMTNIEDAKYYGETDGEHIRYIAENGYWGTTSGTGSLKELKKWLKAQGEDKTGLTNEQIESLTHGEALTATQAAIWHFGNSGTTDVGTTYKNIVGNYNTNGNVVGADHKTPAGKKDITQKLYEFLIKGQTKAPDETVFITEEVFATTSTITVGEKVTEKNADGTDKTDADGNTVFKMTNDEKAIYKADVSFGMSVTPSQNGDLLVNVVVDGKTVATRRLAGESKEGEKFGKITPDENGNYTISGLELPNGSTITLNLSGTQDLAKGVYLYTCTTGHTGSQTFVGMGEGKREVDLSVNVNFNVTEPEAAITKTASGNTQEKTDTVTETREDKITQKQVSAEITVSTITTTEDRREWEDTWHYDRRPDEGDDDADADADADADDDADADADADTDPDSDVVSRTRVRPERDRSDIGDEPTPLAAIADEDVPLAMIPDEEVPLAEIFDEDVPLAAVPKTGDISGLWYAGLLFSALGLMVLSRKKREDA